MSLLVLCQYIMFPYFFPTNQPRRLMLQWCVHINAIVLQQLHVRRHGPKNLAASRFQIYDIYIFDIYGNVWKQTYIVENGKISECWTLNKTETIQKKMICGRMHGSANRWSMMCCREKMVETHPKQNVTWCHHIVCPRETKFVWLCVVNEQHLLYDVLYTFTTKRKKVVPPPPITGWWLCTHHALIAQWNIPPVVYPGNTKYPFSTRLSKSFRIQVLSICQITNIKL